MKINYLENTQDFLNKESYLDSLDTYFIQDVYSMGLDEEIDIFSELPIELFAGNSKNQCQMVVTDCYSLRMGSSNVRIRG